MKTYQHNLEKVEDYLHHRAPYLMVGEIVSIEQETVVTQTFIDKSLFFVDGHFPGAPIVPGAMLQEMTTQSAGIMIAARHNPMEKFNTHDPFFNEFALGVLVRINGARFRGFARSGDTVQTTVRLIERIGDLFDFSAEITCDGMHIMRNSFRLANIKSSTLQGK